MVKEKPELFQSLFKGGNKKDNNSHFRLIERWKRQLFLLSYDQVEFFLNIFLRK
jgi:hypothetical protein